LPIFFATPLSFFPNLLHISLAYQFLVQKKKKNYLHNYNLSTIYLYKTLLHSFATICAYPRWERARRCRQAPVRCLSVQWARMQPSIPISLLVYTELYRLRSLFAITSALWHCKTKAPEHSLEKNRFTCWKRLEFNLVKNRPRGANF
jgi:hypothetical protein